MADGMSSVLASHRLATKDPEPYRRGFVKL